MLIEVDEDAFVLPSILPLLLLDLIQHLGRPLHEPLLLSDRRSEAVVRRYRLSHKRPRANRLLHVRDFLFAFWIHEVALVGHDFPLHLGF